MSKKIQYILFDLDGTLIDSANCSVVATQRAFNFFSLNIPTSDSIINLMGIPIETSFKDLGADVLSDDEFDELLKLFRKEYKNASENEIVIFPNIVDLLKLLKNRGAKIAVITSKKTNVAIDNLTKLLINSYFDYVIGSDKVSKYKPDPEGLIHVLSYFGLDQKEYNKVIYIGDAVSDMIMAKSVNVLSCGVTWGAHSKEKLMNEKPDYIVDNVYQLQKLLNDDILF